MKSPLWPDPLYGQCKCGATLTINHLRHHCPFRPQPPQLQQLSILTAIARSAYQERLDTTHVAVLGEN